MRPTARTYIYLHDEDIRAYFRFPDEERRAKLNSFNTIYMERCQLFEEKLSAPENITPEDLRTQVAWIRLGFLVHLMNYQPTTGDGLVFRQLMQQTRSLSHLEDVMQQSAALSVVACTPISLIDMVHEAQNFGILTEEQAKELRGRIGDLTTKYEQKHRAR
jgi:hypothetical protein